MPGATASSSMAEAIAAAAATLLDRHAVQRVLLGLSKWIDGAAASSSSSPHCVIAALAAAIIAGALALALSARRRRAAAAAAAAFPRAPALPLLGLAPALARRGVAVVSAARKLHGRDAVAVDVGLGQALHFVFAPALLEAFFRSPEHVVAFKPAVVRFTERWGREREFVWG